MKNIFKSPLFCWLGFIFLLFLLALLPISCKSQKPIVEKQTTVNVDSLKQIITKLTEINREIKDKTIIPIPDVSTGNIECDSICNERIRQLLQSFNREIESGNNSYRLLYDEHKKTLEILAEIAMTKNEVNQTDTSQYKGENSTQLKEVPVYVIPDFWRYSAYLGWAFAVLIIFKVQNKLQTWRAKKSTI